MNQKLLNVGCGAHYHSDWVNIDIYPVAPEVIKFDINKGLPFDDNSFDAVYSSHMLEHLTRNDGIRFLKEMYRVLRPGGIIRIVVPDLEQICRLYLEKLEMARAGDEKAIPDYEWMRLELFDQIARDVGGGDMLQYLIKDDLQNRDFIISRIGQEAKNIWDPKPLEHSTRTKTMPSRSFLNGLTEKIIHSLLRHTGQQDAIDALTVGRFRASGEIHRFMYDEYSCRMALQAAGFVEAKQLNSSSSDIASFSHFFLDELEDGLVRKPDSIFVEARKTD